MILKKDKEEVLKEIYAKTSGTVYSSLYSQLNMKVDTGSVASALQTAIAQAITDGFRVLLENRYTDDDFEKDMTIKS